MTAFRALVLGAAAGGGLPQWNCGCANCDAARRGDIPSATQSSVAVTADGTHWAILNASPDIRVQLARTPQLHPTDLRALPVHSVLLTNGDIDHVAGLLTLREQQPFTLFATDEIQTILGDNPMFNALATGIVGRDRIALDQPFALAPGLTATLFTVPGKVPLYNEGDVVQTDLEAETTVGVELIAGDKRILYIPGCAKVTDRLAARIDGADILFFDGTLWTDDEMVTAGLSQKTGQRMGHISMSGGDGSIASLAPLKIGQRVFVHMNNTNPVLDPASMQHKTAQEQGWTIAYDGLEITT